MRDLSTWLLSVVSDSYLLSGDYNGVTIQALMDHEKDHENLFVSISDLVKNNKIRLKFSGYCSFPHINRIGFLSVKEQLSLLKDFSIRNPDEYKIDLFIPGMKNSFKRYVPDSYPTFCCYPTESHLRDIVNLADFSNRPFDLALALGAPQLEFWSFDLKILEYYRNDPRYYYKNSDFEGSIYRKDEDNASQDDPTYLKTFGFSYDENKNRAVSVYLRYLKSLSAPDQVRWNLEKLSGDYHLHPDYFTRTLLGRCSPYMSICDAILNEIRIINQMSESVYNNILFKNNFHENGEYCRPERYGLLIRPTRNEFIEFIKLLDKILSDNIDKRFFKNMNIEIEREDIRSDGKIIVTPKGTITLLDEWVRTEFDREVKSWELWAKSIQTFRTIRKNRNKESHSIHDDAFDQKYIMEQRIILTDTHDAIRTLRIILESRIDTNSLDEMLLSSEIKIIPF